MNAPVLSAILEPVIAGVLSVSPFPLDGMLRWYDFDDAVGPTDDPINSLPSRVGTGDLTATLTTRPLINDDGPDSGRYARFDGIDDHMDMPVVVDNDSFSIFALAQTDNPGGTGSILGGDSASYFYAPRQTTLFRLRTQGGSTDDLTLDAALDTSWTLWHMTKASGAVPILYRDGVLETGSFTLTTHELNFFLVSGNTPTSNNWDGGIGAIGFYDRPNTPDEVAAVTNFYSGWL